jgi:predicted amidohydrolase
MEQAEDSALICFPETCVTRTLTSYGCDGDAIGDLLEPIREQARELGIWAVVGAYVKRHGEIFNEAYLINRNGELAHTHQKVRLSEAEKQQGRIVRGTGFQAVKTDFATVGILVCADILSHSYPAQLTRAGAEILLCPAFWPKSSQMSHNPQDAPYLGYPQVRAHEHTSYIAFCDAYQTGRQETVAKSMILAPSTILAQAEGPCVITAEVYPRLIRGMRADSG